MSTLGLHPVFGKENPTAPMLKNIKELSRNKTSNIKGIIKSKFNATSSQRSFGDISNCLQKAKQEEMTNDFKAAKSRLAVCFEQQREIERSVDDKDVIPDFDHHEDDYSDLLPPHLNLSEETIHNFACFWKHPSKPPKTECFEGEFSSFEDLSFLTALPAPEEDLYELEPVSFEMNLPPPMWD